MAFEFDRAVVPEDLAARPQWLIWRFEVKTGQAKPAKMPYYADGARRKGEQGSAADRAALVTLEVALDNAQRRHFNGVGLAFLPDDGLIGIDLDKVINTETGVIKPGAQKIIDALASYTEVSPSGTGVHVIVRGPKIRSSKDNGIGVEVFCGSQFFTFSARRYPGTPPQVREVDQAALDRLLAVVEAAKAKGGKRAAAAGASAGPSAGAAAGASRGVSDFARANEMALANLDAWVPALFPGAQRSSLGYRVPQAVLGRSLQEDLSITSQGIVDFGVADQGDARAGRRTPLDLVIEWGGHARPADALRWLASAVGLSLDAPLRGRTRAPQAGRAAAKTISTPSQARAEGGDEGGGDGGTGGGDAPPDGPADMPPAPPDDDDWRRYLIRKRGELKECRENVLIILRDHPDWRDCLGVDTFAKRIVIRRDSPIGQKAGAEWSANDDIELGLWLAQQEGLQVSSLDAISAGVSYVAKLRPFHPVREYFDALTWDRMPRLDSWGVRLLGCADDEYDRLVGRLFLLNLVRRIYEPGCVMRSVPVLEGAQNKGKSTALRLLSHPWYSDTMFKVGDKDAFQLIQGVMLYEISELESFSRSEATAVKAFISSVQDKFRAPYARSPETHLRETMFAATTNAREYLKDWTGNTRFWPWRLMVDGEIDLDAIARERDQLLAEAIDVYRTGRLAAQTLAGVLDDPDGSTRARCEAAIAAARSHPTREQEEALFAPQQDERLVAHPWQEKLRAYLAQTGGNRFTVMELLKDGIGFDVARASPQGMEAQTVGRVMASLPGWEKRRTPSGWVWERPRAGVASIDVPGRAADTAELKEDRDVPF